MKKRRRILRAGDVVMEIRPCVDFEVGAVGVLRESQRDMYGYACWLVEDGFCDGIFGVPSRNLEVLEGAHEG